MGGKQRRARRKKGRSPASGGDARRGDNGGDAPGASGKHDASTLDTSRGSCDNSYCPCDDCRCGSGCACRPPVPSVIGVGGDGDAAASVGGVQFALAVSGMTCGGCASTVENALRNSSEGVVDVRIDLAGGTALVAASASWLLDSEGRDGAASALVRAVEDAGFGAEVDATWLGEDAGEAPDGEPESGRTDGGTGTLAEMEDPEEAECGICLTALCRPVTLPCGHVFSSGCLDRWRDRYDAGHVRGRTCPLCRGAMPPSPEVLSQLASWRRALGAFGGDDEAGREYARGRVAELEEALGGRPGVGPDGLGPPGDVGHADDVGGGEGTTVLPERVARAAMRGDARSVLRWVGTGGRRRSRIDARAGPDMMGVTLLHCAAANGRSGLCSLLLQGGADKDARDAAGLTPLGVRGIMDGADVSPAGGGGGDEDAATVLLGWGATAGDPTRFASEARHYGNVALARLLESELGGRRCEIVDLPTRPDVVGTTCVANEYLPDSDKYRVTLETGTREVMLLGPDSLRRRDRTPRDCGHYVELRNGRAVRRDFDSGEECRAYVAAHVDE